MNYIFKYLLYSKVKMFLVSGKIKNHRHQLQRLSNIVLTIKFLRQSHCSFYEEMQDNNKVLQYIHLYSPIMVEKMTNKIKCKKEK